MITAFQCEDLFELNDQLTVEFDQQNQIVIIDNFFKHYDDIIKYVYNLQVEAWKTSPTSANFKEYFDCRHTLANTFPIEDKISKRLGTMAGIVKQAFGIDVVFTKSFDFNLFKHATKDIPNGMQWYPHYDSGNLNVITYIDTVSNGGTAIYKNVQPWENHEEKHALCDITNLEIEHIIEAKPNRCAIFSGDRLHNAYAHDHNAYYDDWRINLVNFAIPRDRISYG